MNSDTDKGATDTDKGATILHTSERMQNVMPYPPILRERCYRSLTQQKPHDITSSPKKPGIHDEYNHWQLHVQVKVLYNKIQVFHLH